MNTHENGRASSAAWSARDFAGKRNRKENARWAPLDFLAKSASGIFGLGVLTGAALLLHMNLATVGLLYFLSVVLVALHWGFGQAAVLSAAAVLCQSYFFIPPIYSLSIADPQSYVTLGVFEFSVLLVSRLSVREQRHARGGKEQRRSMVLLNDLRQKIDQLALHLPPGPQLVQLVQKIFAVESIAIFDSDLDTIDVSGPFPLDPEEMARNTTYFAMNKDYDDLDFSRRVLRLDSAPIGALLIGGKLNPQTVDAIASLISMSYDRYRSFASEARAETAHPSAAIRTSP